MPGSQGSGICSKAGTKPSTDSRPVTLTMKDFLWLPNWVYMWWVVWLRSFLNEPHKGSNKWGFKWKVSKVDTMTCQQSINNSREWFLIVSQVKSAVLSRGLRFTNCRQLDRLMTKACHPSQLPPSMGTATEGLPPSGAVPLLLDTHVTFASLSLSCPSNFNSENRGKKFLFFLFLHNSLWKIVEAVQRQIPVLNNLS